MKKTILTFFIFALSFSMFAQINAYQRFRVYGSAGFVNIRAGAGIGYEVIDTRRNGQVVYRNSSNQVVNSWVPVVYRDTTFHREFHRGFIHQNLLIAPIEEWWEWGTQMVASEINTEKREQLQRQVNKIRTMELRHDTLFYTPQNRWGNVLLEVLSFDEAGRLRKFFYDYAMTDASGWYNTIIAYYNEQGELIHIFYAESGNHSGEKERHWLHEGRIVDFLIEWSGFRCEVYPDKPVWSEERINRLRANVGTPLTKTMVSLNIMSLTDFLDAQTLLSIVRSEDYRGQTYRRVENYMGWEREN